MKRFAAIAVIGLLVRLVLAYVSPTTVDMSNYQIDVDILRRGGNIYAEFQYYNYSPLWSYWLLSCSYLANWLHQSFPFIVRASLSLVDLANAFLIFRLSGRFSAFAAYWLNPAVILVVGYHGQFDTLAMLPVLTGFVLMRQNKSIIFIGFLGALALIVKQITLFSVLALFLWATPNKTRFVTLTLSAVFAFLLTFVPFLSAREGIVAHVFGHSGAIGYFGLSVFLPDPMTTIIFAVFMPLVLLFFRYHLKADSLPGLHASSLAFVFSAPGFYGHYLLMPLITGAFSNPRWYFVFSISSLIFLVAYYGFVDFSQLRILTWVVSASWLIALSIQHAHSIHAGNQGYPTFHNSTTV